MGEQHAERGEGSKTVDPRQVRCPRPHFRLNVAHGILPSLVARRINAARSSRNNTTRLKVLFSHVDLA